MMIVPEPVDRQISTESANRSGSGVRPRPLAGLSRWLVGRRARVYWPDVTAVVALAVLTAAYFWTLIFTNDYTVLAFPDDSIQSFTWSQY